MPLYSLVSSLQVISSSFGNVVFLSPRLRKRFSYYKLRTCIKRYNYLLYESAIIGIGLLKGLRAARRMTVRDTVLPWIVTLLVATLLVGFAYLFLSQLS